MRDDFRSRSFSDVSAPRSGFSDMAISPLESLVLACALEEARSGSQDAMDQYEYEMNPLDYERLLELPGNDRCADCGAEDTEWSSVTFGIFLCAHCSGIHRAMGTHISRVRSVKMDSWSPEHLRRMECGGNDQCNAVLLTNKDQQDPVTAEALKAKYSSKTAQDYKLLMDERVKEGAVNTHTHAISRPTGGQRRTSIKAPKRLPPRNKSSPSTLTGRTRMNPFANAATSNTTIAASAPTIVYMGRTFAADSVQPPNPKAQRRATMGTSTVTPDPHRELRAFLEPEMQPFFFDQQDILDITSNQSEFARLKKSLKNKGAITNQLIKQKMHIFVLNRKKRMADHGGDAQDLQRSVSMLTQVA